MNDETIIRLRNINAKLETLNKLLEPPLTTAITGIQEDIQEIINNEEIEDVLNDDNIKIHIEEPRIIDKDRAKEVKELLDKIIEEMDLPYEPYWLTSPSRNTFKVLNKNNNNNRRK